MNELLFAINGLLMLATPLLIGAYIARRYGAEWGLFGAGALTFVLSQVLHIPFNALVSRFLPPVEVEGALSVNLIVVAVFLGLSAGVFEEVGRYITFRYWRKDARLWKDGMMVGAGHGGIESLIIGLIFTANIIVLLGFSRGYFVSLIPAEAMADVQAQVQELVGLAWYEKVLGGVERVLAITLHLSLSLMVLRSVKQRSLAWLLIAILWHALFNAVAVVLSRLTAAVVVEAVLALFALASLLLIWRWRNEEAAEEAARPETHAPIETRNDLAPLPLTGDHTDDLDDSRYVS